MTTQHTSFVVAQRISTVLKADKIVVLDKGQIAAQGTHAELMQTSPIYQEIYDSQLGNGFAGEIAVMTLQSSSQTSGDARASMQGRRPAQVGKIEKARDPRRALAPAGGVSRLLSNGPW